MIYSKVHDKISSMKSNKILHSNDIVTLKCFHLSVIKLAANHLAINTDIPQAGEYT